MPGVLRRCKPFPGLCWPCPGGAMGWEVGRKALFVSAIDLKTEGGARPPPGRAMDAGRAARAWSSLSPSGKPAVRTERGRRAC